MRRRDLILTAPLALAACATGLVQTPLSPAPDFTGPRLDDDAYLAFDGARLGLSKWEAAGEPWAVIVALHGMNDYAQAFWRAGPAWAAAGVTTYAYDQRGYGRSPHRGVWAGQDLIVRDIRVMVDLVRAKHPAAIIAVAGVSMGGAAAIAAFAGDDPPRADRVILLSPAVWGWSVQPTPSVVALWAANRVFPGWEVAPPPYIARKFLPTDNDAEMHRLSTDRLMVWGARTDTIYGMMDLMEHALTSTGRIRAPTAYLYGYRDKTIPRAAAVHAAGALKPTDKTGFYLDGYHLLLCDNQAPRVWADVVGFIRDPAAPLVSGVPPIPKA